MHTGHMCIQDVPQTEYCHSHLIDEGGTEDVEGRQKKGADAMACICDTGDQLRALGLMPSAAAADASDISSMQE